MLSDQKSHVPPLSTTRESTSMKVEDVNEDSTGNTPSNGPPQCRICFDGPDQDLGRLIRPCLCKGSISVGLRPNYDQLQAICHLPLACPYQVLAEVEGNLRLDERVLALPPMSLPLSFR